MQTDWAAPDLSRLPSWKGHSRIGIDTETRDDHLKGLGPGVRRGAYITGISFAIEDVGKWYLPIRHEGGGNLNPAHVWQYLKDQAREYTGDICGANLSYDLDFLAEEGLVFRQNRFRDIQVAEPLLDENQFHYSLEAIAQKYGFAGKDEVLLRRVAAELGLDPKKEMWKLPAKFVGPYAEEDAALPLRILRVQEKLIDEEDLNRIYDLECRVLPVLVKMRRRGVRVDWDHLDKIEAWSIEAETQLLDVIHTQSGVRIPLNGLNKKGPLAAVLDDQGIPYNLTEKAKQPQITKESLAPYVSNPAVSAILHAKYVNKLRNTFVKSVREHATNGRIHCTFNQLRRQEQGSDEAQGAGPGRLSCCHPNLQQQPGRIPDFWDNKMLDVEIHKFWRKVYLPDEGGEWAGVDLSGQEPRMFVHYAALCECTGAQEALIAIRDHGLDFHDTTTKLAFDVAKDDTDPKEFKYLRTRSKGIFLGCLAEGTPILTHRGYIPIEDVTANDLVWDGASWVRHGGVMAKGDQKCLQVNNIWLTIDHEIWTPCGWFQAQDLPTNSLKSEWCLGNSLLSKCRLAQEGGSSPSNVAARAAESVLRSETILSQESLLAAQLAARRFLVRHIRRLNTHSLTHRIVVGFLTESLRSSAGAIRKCTQDTADVVYRCSLLGRIIANSFLHTSSRFLDGTIPLSKLTGSTTTAGTPPEICDLFRTSSICETQDDEEQTAKELLQRVHNAASCFLEDEGVNDIAADGAAVQRTQNLRAFATYDLLNAGPNCRFQAGSLIVSNSIYGMGEGKLCHTLGYPTVQRTIRGVVREVAGAEGKAFLREFNAKVPFLKQMKSKVEAMAKARGYIITIGGRHIHYVKGRGDERKALNNLIQGCLCYGTYVIDKKHGMSKIGALPEDVTVWDGETWAAAKKVYTGMKRKVTITLKNGQTIECSKNHMFLRVNTLGAEIWTRADELRPGDFVRRAGVCGDFAGATRLQDHPMRAHWKAPNGPANAKRLSFEEIEDPFYRGVVLGRIASDGCYSGSEVRLLVGAPERHITDELLCRIPFKYSTVHTDRSLSRYSIHSIALVRQCRSMDLKNRIPEYVLQHKEVLRGYLRGFFDGDGGVSIGRSNDAVQCGYSVIHLAFGRRHATTQLPRDIQTALTVFGISSRLHVYDTSVRLRVVQKDNNTFLREIGFINCKKTEKVTCSPRRQHLRIGEVEKIKSIDFTDEMVPMYDIVNSATGKFAANGIVVHNSSADQIKMGMVEADDAGIRLQLQVHDELDLTVWDRAEAKQLADIMENCVQIGPGSKADVEIGKSWGDSMSG